MRRARFALFLVVAACGDDGNRHIVDAPPQPDTPPLVIDAAPLPVTLTITRDGAPLNGEKVYFQNADSTLVSATTTDATGTAMAVMVAGGFVTAVDPFAAPAFGGIPADTLMTFAGVKPGDHLVLQQTTPAPIQVMVTAPLDTVNAGISSYLFESTCGNADITPAIGAGSGTVPSGLVQLTDCNGTADIMVVTEDQNGDPISYIYLPAQSVTAPIDLSAQAYVTSVQRDHEYDNYPDPATNLDFFDSVTTNRGVVFPHQAVVATGNPVTVSVHMPMFSGAREVLLASESPPATLGTRNILEWNPAATTDFAAHMLPDIATFPINDATLHTITWTETTHTLAADFVRASVHVFRSADGHSWNWMIAAPVTTTIQFPTLPTTPYDFNSDAGDSWFVQELFTAKVPGGYDAARGTILVSSGPSDYVVGSAGSIEFQVLQNLLFARLAPRTLRPRWSGLAR